MRAAAVGGRWADTRRGLGMWKGTPRAKLGMTRSLRWRSEEVATHRLVSSPATRFRGESE